MNSLSLSLYLNFTLLQSLHLRLHTGKIYIRTKVCSVFSSLNWKIKRIFYERGTQQYGIIKIKVYIYLVQVHIVQWMNDKKPVFATLCYFTSLFYIFIFLFFMFMIRNYFVHFTNFAKNWKFSHCVFSQLC